jgi:hypothetical protein
MASFPTPDESFARLHRTGWSVGDVRILTAEGPAWLVGGRNGENLPQHGPLAFADDNWAWWADTFLEVMGTEPGWRELGQRPPRALYRPGKNGVAE